MTISTYTPVPSSHLSDYVIQLWEVQNACNSTETIIPKGVVELVFNLGGEFTGTLPGAKKMETPACFIQGFNTGSIHVDYTGQQHLFGVRLMPSMVKALYKIESAELKNTVIDLTLINSKFMYLWHQLMEAKSFSKRVQIIEKEFPLMNKSYCLRTQKLCTMFFANSIKGFETVDSLARAINYSPRQANRKAHSLFGLSGEELIAYKKFLRSVDLLHSADLSLTEIAYASGFFDQAHFCKKFKMYAGITAGEYISSKGESPFHIYS